MSNNEPGCSRAVIIRFDQTVHATSGSAAASASPTPSGTGSNCTAGTAAYSAYPPPASKAHTDWPTDQPVTPGPTSAMVPETSSPRVSLAPGGGG
jgi:hypothetical protein